MLGYILFMTSFLSLPIIIFPMKWPILYYVIPNVPSGCLVLSHEEVPHYDSYSIKIPMIFLNGSHFHHHNESTKQHTLIPTLDHFAHPQAELDDALVETSTSAAQTTLVSNLHLEKGSLASPRKWADHRSLGISWDFLRGKSYIKNGCIWRPLKILKHGCLVWIQWE